MALPATGLTITLNQVQVHYGNPTGTQRSMSQLSPNVGITAGQTVKLSESFGGQP